jgi:hypothetical protein
MNTHIRWKYVNAYLTKTKVHDTACVARYHVYTEKKLFEFIKYNNICSLTAILN